MLIKCINSEGYYKKYFTTGKDYSVVKYGAKSITIISNDTRLVSFGLKLACIMFDLTRLEKLKAFL